MKSTTRTINLEAVDFNTLLIRCQLILFILLQRIRLGILPTVPIKRIRLGILATHLQILLHQPIQVLQTRNQSSSSIAN